MATMSRKIPVIFQGLAACLLFTSLLAACAPAGVPGQSITPTPGITFDGQLTPYHASTSTSRVTARPEETFTPLPSPTPTPRTHQVKKGEDLGGIAYQYRVTVPELMAANPKVNPNAMSVGTLLTIPPSKTQMPTASPNPSAPSPSLTPIPLETGQLRCIRDQSQGIWCFLPVRNNQTFTLESISAVFQLASSGGALPLTRTAFLPLDLLPPGETLPLAAYFTPQEAQSLNGPFQASSTLLTALTGADNGRYIDTQLENEKVMISADGLSAAISADVRLKPEDAKAKRVWVAVVAYDAQGQVVGIRRWENGSGQVLQNGAALPVAVNIYSVSGSINKVSLIAEARP